MRFARNVLHLFMRWVEPSRRPRSQTLSSGKRSRPCGVLASVSGHIRALKLSRYRTDCARLMTSLGVTRTTHCGWFANVRFCNGPSCQVTRYALPLATCFCPWSARSCHIIRSEEAGSPSFQRRLQGSDCGHCGFTIFTVQRWDHGPALANRPDLSSSPPHAMAAASLVQRKLVPSTHMR